MLRHARLASSHECRVEPFRDTPCFDELVVAVAAAVAVTVVAAEAAVVGVAAAAGVVAAVGVVVGTEHTVEQKIVALVDQILEDIGDSVTSY